MNTLVKIIFDPLYKLPDVIDKTDQPRNPYLMSYHINVIRILKRATSSRIKLIQKIHIREQSPFY